ncbi:Uncharacterised protein [Mycobacteroides abscessus subsp. abscessus]|nr:Uncharacterised protein [Mycobacteroides abscessus subsp. abscessus]
MTSATGSPSSSRWHSVKKSRYRLRNSAPPVPARSIRVAMTARSRLGSSTRSNHDFTRLAAVRIPRLPMLAIGGARKSSAHAVIAGMIAGMRCPASVFAAAFTVKDRWRADIGPRAARALARLSRLVVTAPPCCAVSTRCARSVS